MIVHYDPGTLRVMHTVSLYGPEYLEHVKDDSHFRLAENADHAEIVVANGEDGPHPHRLVDGELVPLALWSPPIVPERTLDGVREKALDIFEERYQTRLSEIPSQSRHRANKEAWACAHLAGDMAHPVLNAEAVSKGIACHELAGRVLKKANDGRENGVALTNQLERAYFSSIAIIKAATSIEEIDDYMAHAL